MSVTKEHLNKLIQQLSDEDVPFAYEFLKKLAEDELNNKHIPYDDEPTTPEDLKEIREAKEAIARGEGIKFRDIEDEIRN